MTCSACGTENPASNRFCEQCGQPLAVACPSCGSPVSPTARFCGQCGTAMAQTASGPGPGPATPTQTGVQSGPAVSMPPAAPGPATPTPSPAPATAERRLVSILFADLVGFTQIAESRDSEEVREILSGYFDRLREVVGRHGGTVEKFIGDAVMAVWGTPVAHEDDAERAVRAGLAMSLAVDHLNDELALPPGTLSLRVGVLTGEAAITLGAEGQGMVAGDLVNTASRVQSVAPPGWVLVDDATRRATEAAITYEEAGTPELKGKSAPVPVWRALRVVAGRRGAGKALGLEAPFVGRDEELRLVTDLFHATIRDRKARLVSVAGVAGIGKSRLAWEFEKYLDGLAETFLWHRGRCLAYGEGVTYWALAEMVRSRARILEDEDPAAVAAKVRAAVETYLADPEERRWVEPRLAHLLGVEPLANPDRQELFGAWRLFFERLAERNPVVMVFEDLQWADAALLDFIEHLLDWSRNHPLYILTLARPELTDRRTTWGAASRAFTSLHLEPLSDLAVEELVRGLVPGLSDDLVDRIRARAEGIPLYAVETVRMLLDRGVVRSEGSRYAIAGDVGTLEVPETLHSLIAARIDGLGERERSVLRDAAVLGQTFPKLGLTAVTTVEPPELDEILVSLVRKEFLTVETDPLSPERGQYTFLQALIRDVAYQTLSKRERKSRHLAVAGYLESAPDAEEIVQIVASHYLDAYNLAPDAPDAGTLKAKARETLERAGQRAGSLAANDEARRYFERALELAEEPLDQARLSQRAGDAAWAGALVEPALRHWERAIRDFESLGRTVEAARVSATLATVLWDQGRLEEAVERMERAYAALSEGPQDEGLATVGAELARLYHFRGELERARQMVEAALVIAERHSLPEVLSNALNTKSLVLSAEGRKHEASALLRHSLGLALEHELPTASLRAYNNIVVETDGRGDFEKAREYAERALALARKLGTRFWEWVFLAKIAFSEIALGSWDEALERIAAIPSPDQAEGSAWPFSHGLMVAGTINAHRGDVEEARRALGLYEGLFGDSSNLQDASIIEELRALVLGASGDHRQALAAARKAVEAGKAVVGVEFSREALARGLDSALRLGDLAAAEDLLADVEAEPGERSRWTQAQMARFRARLAIAREREKGIEPEFKAAAAIWRDLGAPFWLAVVLLEHAEWLAGKGQAAEAGPLLEEAQAIFERLRAAPWLARAADVEAKLAGAAVPG